MNENEKELIEQEAKRRYPVDAPTEDMQFKIPTKMYRQFLRYAFKEGAQFNHNLAKQSVEQEAGTWQTTRPDFKTECICLTKTGDCLNSYRIGKVETDEGWYMGWLTMDGEEYGDLSDLTADKYLILPLP
jgi:hypothetical protein